MVLPLTDQELTFFELLNARGQIVPELITDDGRLQNIIGAHPGLQWKALNVRQHR